jgi:hypothetical protein
LTVHVDASPRIVPGERTDEHHLADLMTKRFGRDPLGGKRMIRNASRGRNVMKSVAMHAAMPGWPVPVHLKTPRSDFG